MVDRGNFDKTEDLGFVDMRVKSFTSMQNETWLPTDFQPTLWTVICGRGKKAFNHVGNRRFRLFCEINLLKYEATHAKAEKSVIVMSIVDAIREASGNAGFVKKDPKTQRWFEVGTGVAREKVGQQLRELAIKKPIPIDTHGPGHEFGTSMGTHNDRQTTTTPPRCAAAHKDNDSILTSMSESNHLPQKRSSSIVSRSSVESSASPHEIFHSQRFFDGAYHAEDSYDSYLASELW